VTIEIENPEDEQIIQTRLARGEFRTVPELIHHALVSLPTPAQPFQPKTPKQNLADILLESPLYGSDLSLEPDQGTVPISYGPRPKTAAEAVAHILEARKGNLLPPGVTIRDLINEGRA
jgi:hypothetical protein